MRLLKAVSGLIAAVLILSVVIVALPVPVAAAAAEENVSPPIESPHPYPNYYYNEWTISKSGAAAIKVFFDYISVEGDYDWIFIMDGNYYVYEIITGVHDDYWTVWVPGDTVIIALESDYSNNAFGFNITKYKYTDTYTFQPSNSTYIVRYEPPTKHKLVGVVGESYTFNIRVKSVDGYHYPVAIGIDNPMAGILEITSPESVVLGLSTQISTFDLVPIIESPHPYPNNYDNSWTITHPGAARIRVFFDYIEVETGWDYIYIEDADHVVYESITGIHDDYWSVWVPGDTLVIHMVSDFSITWWGFNATKYQVEVMEFPVVSLDEPVESPHPYKNCSNILRSISEPNAIAISVFFDYIELKDAGDIIYIMDADGVVWETIQGPITIDDYWTDMISGSTVNVKLVSNCYGTAFGFNITKYKYWPSYITGPIESPHPYPNNYDHTWVRTVPGASRLRLYFDFISLEPGVFDEYGNLLHGFDWLYIYDGDDNLVYRITGYNSTHAYEAVSGTFIPATGWVTGWIYSDTVKVRLVTDYVVWAQGFRVSQVQSDQEDEIVIPITITAKEPVWTQFKVILSGYNPADPDSPIVRTLVYEFLAVGIKVTRQSSSYNLPVFEEEINYVVNMSTPISPKIDATAIAVSLVSNYLSGLTNNPWVKVEGGLPYTNYPNRVPTDVLGPLGIPFETPLESPHDIEPFSPIESPHPYPADYSEKWEIYHPNASEIQVFFENITLESGDVVYIKDKYGHIYETITTNVTNYWSVWVPGDTLVIHLKEDGDGLTAWGINATQYRARSKWSLSHCGADRIRILFERIGLRSGDAIYIEDLAGTVYETITGNHTDYWTSWIPVDTVVIVLEITNSPSVSICTCAGEVEGPKPSWGFKAVKIQSIFTSSVFVESPHPYPNNAYMEWTISQPMASAVRVHFSWIQMEWGYDYITIMDDNYNVYERITGYRTNYWSVWVPGSTVKIRLASDFIINYNGFVIDQIEWVYADYSLLAAIGGFSSSVEFSYKVYRVNYMVEKYWNSMPYHEWSVDDITARVRIGFDILVWIYNMETEELIPVNSEFDPLLERVELSTPIESPHPYPNNYDATYPISEPGAKFMRVFFDTIELRTNDVIYIEDTQGIIYEVIKENMTDHWSAWVPGDTIIVHLITNNDGKTAWGFNITKYDALLGCTTLRIEVVDEGIIDIGDYSATTNLNWISIQKGYTGELDLTIKSLGGYSTDLMIVIEGLPEGLQLNISGTEMTYEDGKWIYTVTLEPGEELVLPIDITVPELGVASGTYMFTIKVIDLRTGTLRIITPLHLIVI